MASRGNAPPPTPKPPTSQKWAQIASNDARSTENSPLHKPQLLNKLKNSTSQFVRLDEDSLARASMGCILCMENFSVNHLHLIK